ncbi:hypothetical protein HYH03_015284 [Edaphochlamys debaryana]|uniref:WRKY domain-containing protein n=1 Tax=Edaphochlamys debaryana TaxID=47281 RepID=A0A835XPU3_9CHLO|nr:hypothetical protein HYH03_015284 [Edaphochlamys debaryana]|eukprot:KAG2486081.1 hypothetical protein HYH03_015284 [Edaphochlamys debaryana]
MCPPLPLFQSQSQPSRLPLPIPARTEAASGAEASRGVKREYEPRIGNGKQSVANSDGWQWRKYGEKLVKGSPNPRSYYKCSHNGCLAKKIVERSEADGTVLSTEYKGDHCHPAPLAVKTSRFKPKAKVDPPMPVAKPEPPPLPQFPPGGLMSPPQLGMLGTGGMLPIPEALKSDFPGPNQPAGTTAAAQEDDSDTSDPEPVPALKAAPQDARPAQAAATAIRRMRESQDSPSKRLDLLAAYAEEAERQLHSNSNSPENQQPAKRQRTEAAPTTTRAAGEEEEQEGATASGSGTTRIVDITNMDDGYRWRKYGQKTVKGSPFPRAYYKCTYLGCTVRKHVERSAEDETRFVVTYEGQHNHRPPGVVRRRSPKGTADADDDGEADEAEEDSSQPTSPQYGTQGQSSQQGGSGAVSKQAGSLPLPVPPGSADVGQQIQQLQNSILASSMLQQAALSGVLPLLPYQSLSSEALASLGLSAEALHSMEALSSLNLASVSNLADLTNLLRQHAQIDMAIAAQAQAMDAASAGWDPLACLITPRTNVSPGNGPAGQAQAAASAGTGRQGKSAAVPARQQVATTEA